MTDKLLSRVCWIGLFAVMVVSLMSCILPIPIGSMAGSQVLVFEILSKEGDTPVVGATVEWIRLSGNDRLDRDELEQMLDNFPGRIAGGMPEGITDASGHVELDVGCVIVQTGQKFPAKGPLGFRITIGENSETLVIDLLAESTAESDSYTATVTTILECVPREYQP